jgi:hypothetical protein
MAPNHRTAPTDRIEAASADHYLPAMPSEKLVTAFRRLSAALKRSE